MKYPVSVWIDYYREVPVEEAIRLLSQAGFRYGELSDIHLPRIMERGDPAREGARLKAFADSLGYTIPQAHLSYQQGLTDGTVPQMLMPELDMMAALGVKKAVLHIGGGNTLEQKARYDAWIRNLQILANHVEGTGITLCLENLMSIPESRTAHSLLQVICDAGDKNLAICLDTGHLHFCNCQGLASQSQGDFIRTAGDKLQALHIADNNGLADTHQMPFSARYGIDWKDVMQGLWDIDYKGLFNLEIVGEWEGTPAIKAAKLAFVRQLTDAMLSDAFVK